MGRPPFEDPALVRSERLSITLTAEEKRAIKEGAGGRGMTASTFTRQAVLTDPAVVPRLVEENDYETVRQLAADWIRRTEMMAQYFLPYLEGEEPEAFQRLLETFRERVAWFDANVPLDE